MPSALKLLTVLSATGAIVRGSPITGDVLTPMSSDSSGGDARKVFGRDAVGYEMCSGDGLEGWPVKDDWTEFEKMFAANTDLMKKSCGTAKPPSTDNTDDEIASIKKAVETVAGTSKVDPRFILAIVMQESRGCPRAQTTGNIDRKITNPGLMQAQGKTSCMGEEAPCPQEKIMKMIEEGTEGAGTDNVGLKKSIEDATALLGKSTGEADAQTIYWASRIYNSGSHPIGTPLENPARGTTACYASDVANRMKGWAGAETECKVKNP